MRHFKPGDVVKLKAGGPKMTVESDPYESTIIVGGHTVKCVWFDDEKILHRDFFHCASIILAEPYRGPELVGQEKQQ
jgi:uncharacterized protein YodC (DUF2158 family)